MRSTALALVVASILAGCLGSVDDNMTAPSTPEPEEGALGVSFVVHETGFDGYEPTVAVTSDGVFVAGAGEFNIDGEFQGAQASLVIRSQDGSSWESSNQFPATSDPIVERDPVTDRVYRAHQLSSSCSTLAWTDDGGDTWTERPGACGDIGVDFLKLAAGPNGPEPNPAATGESVLYICHNRNSDDQTTVCAASFDGGLTFNQDVVVARRSVDGCGGITSFPAVGPTGEVALPLTGGCEVMTVATSLDSGLTWGLEPIGNGYAAVITPRVAFDADGNLYAFWAESGSLRLAIRDDAGWTHHSLPTDMTSFAFVTMDVVDVGAVAFTFMGTDETLQSASGAEPGTTWTLFAGAWRDGTSAVEAVETMHNGRVCFGGSDCLRNLGDFFDGQTGPDGSYWATYIDGCTECDEDQATGTALKLVEIRLGQG